METSRPLKLLSRGQERPEQSVLMAEQYRQGQGTVVLQTALRTALSGGVLGRQTALLVTASLVSLLRRSEHAVVILQVYTFRHAAHPPQCACQQRLLTEIIESGVDLVLDVLWSTACWCAYQKSWHDNACRINGNNAVQRNHCRSPEQIGTTH